MKSALFRWSAFIGLISLVWVVSLRYPNPRPHSPKDFPFASEYNPSLRNPASLAQALPNLELCKNLYKAICDKKGINLDPTGFVLPDIEGEKKALSLFQSVAEQHPAWGSEQVNEELAQLIYTPERRRNFEGAYRWTEHTLIKIISQQPDSVLSASDKKLLKKRIRSLQLDLPPPASKYDDEVDLFTKNDVYYERLSTGATRLRVGGAYLLSAQSYFNQVATIAHEMAHSIDPCEIKALGIQLPAYQRLTQCFIDQKLVPVSQSRRECGEHDHLSETFADWMAMQVVGVALTRFSTEFDSVQLLNAAANSVKDLCEQKEDSAEADLTYHPSPQTRIENIFGREPSIRSLLGCGALAHPVTYCSFEFVPSGTVDKNL